MKKLLLKVFLLTLSAYPILSPGTSQAQCACSGGGAPNALEHIVVLNPTNQSNTTISFPKFDPALGTLNCVTLNDTLSIVTTTGIRNYDPIPTEYEFQLTINTKVEGPSLTRTNFKNLQYGPDLLGAYGSPTDSINYGPDSIYNNQPSAKTNTSNMTPYLGATGTVNFVYTIGGGVIAVGGANYNAQVRTTTWGVFKLTYYWCDNMVLASSVRNLTVEQAGGIIQLQWQGPENSNTQNFKIETSYDGINFSPVDQGTGSNVIETSSAKYEYQFKPHQPVDRKLYFRIRYEEGGQVRYSSTRALIPISITRKEMSLFPNPAVKSVNLQFNDFLTGDYNVELANQVGMVVLRKTVRLNRENRISVYLDETPPPGIYFLKAVQNGSSKVYSAKLLFTR